MISFMVLGGPRSGTTWAANWLTTSETICLHDPLLEFTPDRLMRMTFADGQRLGISCTSSTLYPEWVNAQRCPKVVLYRPVADINRSLRALGLVELIESRHLARLAAVKDALFVPYEFLFSTTGARQIAAHVGVPFDVARHHYLCGMRIEPSWRHLPVEKEAVNALLQRIAEAR